MNVKRGWPFNETLGEYDIRTDTAKPSSRPWDRRPSFPSPMHLGLPAKLSSEVAMVGRSEAGSVASSSGLIVANNHAAKLPLQLPKSLDFVGLEDAKL